MFKPENQFGSTDLNEVIKNVVKDFDLVIQERNIDIKTGKLPIIEANPLHMNQLFYNLIHNALKFSDSKEKPEIEISAKPIVQEDHAESSRTHLG